MINEWRVEYFVIPMGDEVINMFYSDDGIIMYKRRVSLYYIVVALLMIRLSNLET